MSRTSPAMALQAHRQSNMSFLSDVNMNMSNLTHYFTKIRITIGPVNKYFNISKYYDSVSMTNIGIC